MSVNGSNLFHIQITEHTQANETRWAYTCNSDALLSPSPPPAAPPASGRRLGDATTTYSVSGGYSYSPALPSSFTAGETYTFNAAGVSGSHPFRVGTARGVVPSWVTGDTGGITGSAARSP